MIQFKIDRKYLKSEYTVGDFYYKLDVGDWIWFCNTIEDKVRDYNKDGKLDEAKIYGKTAIPYGSYKFLIGYSPKFKRELPILLDVPGFTGIMIHNGTDENSSSGCIIVGQNKIRGAVINSVLTLNKLVDLLNSNIQSEYNLIIT